MLEAPDKTLRIQGEEMWFLKIKFLKAPFPLAAHFKSLAYSKYHEKIREELE